MVRPKLTEQQIEQKLRSQNAPPPPEALLGRLKADIPDAASLTRRHDEPPRRGWRRGWAVAASILALVGMSYVMVRTLEMSKSAEVSSPALEQASRRADDAPVPARSSPAANEPAAQSKDLDASAAPKNAFATEREKKDKLLRQEQALPEKVGQAYLESRAQPTEVAAEKNEEQPSRENETLRDEAAKRGADSGIAEGAVGGVVGAMAASAPPPPAAPAPKPQVTQSPAGAADAIADAKARGRAPLRMLAKTSGGGQFVDASADPVSTFGLRVADDSWNAVRAALLGGRMPAPSALREEEIINRFDYRDEPTRGEVALHAEAAPAPFGGNRVYVLRVGLRTGTGSNPIASAAAVQVEFNPEVVDAYRLVGYQLAEGGGEAVTRVQLPPDYAVSALYELRLERRPAARQRLGVVRLRYTDATGAHKENMREISGADIAAQWQESSPSMRLSSLSAKWAEVLKHSSFAAGVDPREIMKRAQALSAAFEGDADVADFVALTAQTARLMR